MRKCDICQTPIPSGQVCCPKCGYIRPEDKSKSQISEKTEKPKKIKNKQHKKHSLVFILTVMVVIAVTSVFLIGKVNQYMMKTYSDEVESGTFYDFQSFSEACPTLAEKVSPYYIKVREYQTEDSQLQEVYIVENFVISVVEISVDLQDGNLKKYFSVSNAGKDNWKVTGGIEFEKMDLRDLKHEHLEEITRFCGLNVTTIYEYTLNLYEQLLNSNLPNQTSQFSNRGYDIEVSIENGVKFTVTNSQLGRMG